MRLASATLFALALLPHSVVAHGESKKDVGLDVQVVSAKTGNHRIDGHGDDFWPKCKLYQKTADANMPNHFKALADCTAAAEASTGLPMINPYIERELWLAEGAGVPTFFSPRLWCAEAQVVVAVKASVWNDPNFLGLGFFASEWRLSGEEGTKLSFKKQDSRLRQQGEAMLKNGEKVLLFKFAGVGPCEPNGSGKNPRHSLEFKPFAIYSDKVFWEDVSRNHSIAYDQQWDRSSDLLQ